MMSPPAKSPISLSTTAAPNPRNETTLSRIHSTPKPSSSTTAARCAKTITLKVKETQGFIPRNRLVQELMALQ